MFQINDAFSVKFNEEEGTLLRLVGLIERRQFTITGLVFINDNGINEAVFRVKSIFFDHPSYEQHPPITFHRLKVLLEQIRKIENVTEVRVLQDVEL